MQIIVKLEIDNMSDAEVRCCNCKNFIPDKAGNGQGLGQCEIYLKTPTAAMFSKLGRTLFWGGSSGKERDCCYFSEKIVE